MFGLFDHTVYSFLDLSGVISHPAVGTSYTFTGQGVGRVVVSMEEDKTFHEIGVDGTVILGKIPGGAGKLTIECQQTSNIHKWLLYVYQFLIKADAKEWGRMAAYLRNLNDGTTHTLRGLSYERIPESLIKPKVKWLYGCCGQRTLIPLLPTPVVRVSCRLLPNDGYQDFK